MGGALSKVGSIRPRIRLGNDFTVAADMRAGAISAEQATGIRGKTEQRGQLVGNSQRLYLQRARTLEFGPSGIASLWTSTLAAATAVGSGVGWAQQQQQQRQRISSYTLDEMWVILLLMTMLLKYLERELVVCFPFVEMRLIFG